MVKMDILLTTWKQNKSPRFELYHILIKNSIKKSNDPIDFDEYMNKIWQKEVNNQDV